MLKRMVITLNGEPTERERKLEAIRPVLEANGAQVKPLPVLQHIMIELVGLTEDQINDLKAVLDWNADLHEQDAVRVYPIDE